MRLTKLKRKVYGYIKKIMVLFLGLLLVGSFVSYEAFVSKIIKKDVKVTTVGKQYEKTGTSKHGKSTFYCELVATIDEAAVVTAS